jgi:hypothetical protein
MPISIRHGTTEVLVCASLGWPNVSPVLEAGAIGWGAVRLDDITHRLVAYHTGSPAAHRCTKGHILYVLA